MNLKSCDNCGIVIDVDKRKFPQDIENEEGCIDPELALWNGEDYVPYIKCPLCRSEIT